MLLNPIFNNISVISWRLALLVGETGLPGENHCPVASHWQTLWRNVVSSTPNLRGFQNRRNSKNKSWSLNLNPQLPLRVLLYVLHPLPVVTVYELVPGNIVLECNIHLRLSWSQINLPHLPNELESHKPPHRTRERPDNVMKTEFFISQGGFIFVKWFNNSSVSYFLNIMRKNISDTVRIITDKKMDDHIDQWMSNEASVLYVVF